MDTFIGFLELLAWAAAVLVLAAAITYVVIRISKVIEVRREAARGGSSEA